MEASAAAARLACVLFGAAVGLLLSDRVCLCLCRPFAAGGARLLKILWGISQTTVVCAMAVLAAPLPVPTSILYAGMGVLGAHSLAGQKTQPSYLLSIICPWLILYLPFTGALACLGGALLVLAADVPALAGLAMLVLAAPMALLQFGAEGGLVLLTGAVLLCPKELSAAWNESRGGQAYPG